MVSNKRKTNTLEAKRYTDIITNDRPTQDPCTRAVVCILYAYTLEFHLGLGNNLIISRAYWSPQSRHPGRWLPE